MKTPMVLDWVVANGKKLAVAAVGILLLLPFVGGVVGGAETTFLAVEAPEADENITVFLGKEPGLVGGCPSEATVEIYRGELLVYPGIYGEMEVDDCRGVLEIPYREFASWNGQYRIVAELGDETVETRFFVEKVVNWVYIRSFPNETAERTRVEVALSTVKAQPIRSSVFTSGELVLDVYWESCDEEGPLGTGLGIANRTQECEASHDNVFHGSVPLNTTAVTHVIIPWDNFESDKYEDGQPTEGYYNVTATFHNAEAKANENVPMDPSVYREDPPGNWFEVEYE